MSAKCGFSITYNEQQHKDMHKEAAEQTQRNVYNYLLVGGGEPKMSMAPVEEIFRRDKHGYHDGISGGRLSETLGLGPDVRSCSRV